MGIFSGILLVSDVDGTLLTYDGKIPARNVEMIEYFIREGGLFTVATGRGVVSARRYLERIVHNCAPIVFNGSAIYDDQAERFLWQQPLPESAREVVAYIVDNHPNMGIQIYSEMDMFVLRDSEINQYMVTYEHIPYTMERLEDIRDRHWNKVLCLSEVEEVEQLIESLKRFDLPDTYFVRTQERYYEILAVGADKGNALRHLAELNGIGIDQTYAIGDYYNDVQLVDAAGYSAYTAGAPEELKAGADYIAAPCEAGAVADFIAHIQTHLQ